MKKITTILLMLLASISFAQNNPINFESGGYGANWTWTVFENGVNPAVDIIANPDPMGINTSATVARFTALQSGAPWAGCESAHGSTDLGPFVLDATNSTIKITVPAVNTGQYEIQISWSADGVKYYFEQKIFI